MYILFIFYFIFFYFSGEELKISYSKKGTNTERQVVKLFEQKGYAATRIPASGGATKSDRPDILCGNGHDIYAIEVKSSKKDTIYIRKEQIHELIRFAYKFGAKPLICVKFNRKPHTLLTVNQLSQTKGGNYRIKKTEIQQGTILNGK